MGLVSILNASQTEELAKAEQAARTAAHDTQQANPVIQGLAAHVQKRWELAKQAKIAPEQRLLKCLRQRNGEYDPDKLALIREMGGSEIFMMLTSTKCRGAASWLRDTLLGTGSDKPWTLDATPVPDLPPEVVQKLQSVLEQTVAAYMQATGKVPDVSEVRAHGEQVRDQLMAQMKEEAEKRVDRMEQKMEDQLIEGRFLEGLTEFIDDIVTFPTAIMKGPVPRKRKSLEWQNGGLVPVDKIVLEWERMNPFMAYPAPWASTPHDGYFIERHKLTKEDLEAMIGVPGFDEVALRSVLANFGTSMTESLSIDQEVAIATGKFSAEANRSTDVIDAIQLWDSVQGKLLKEWGLKEVKDAEISYPCEVWKIGSVVIKAVLNYDPLARKPYYTASYEKVPGAFWGNGVADLIRDCQAMCNASARALSNNMGISSGPQVGVNVSRLPTGEQITKMYPWKIWQFQNTDYQDSSKPLDFFQPDSNANELMAVFEKFQTLADEHSGIPRYMTGENTPGAGRTASGLSMMISNASKSIKSVISTIDHHVITPLLERLYQHNLRYSEDPDLIGDINIVAKGAMSLVAKESAAVRRNEFLALLLQNPMAQQICGVLGTAELLRENAKLLDINVDRIVPSREKLEEQIKQAEQAAQAQQQQMMQMAQQPEKQQIEYQTDEQGNTIGATVLKFANPLVGKPSSGLSLPSPSAPKGQETLPDGSPAGGRQNNLQANRVTGRTG